MVVAIATVLLGAGLHGGILPHVVAQDATPATASTDCPSTTPEENKELVRQFMDAVYVGHDPSRVDEFLAADFNRTNPARPHSNEFGTADDAARIERSLAEFPDFTSTVDQMIAEGDMVTVLMTITGANEGALEDLGVLATGRPAEWQSVVIWRISCGQLAENWVVTDRLIEYRQLGIITDDELETVGTPTVATPVP